MKSKLEVPGNGGDGGNLLYGLPGNEALSGVGGCDSGAAFRCCSNAGERSDAVINE